MNGDRIRQVLEDAVKKKQQAKADADFGVFSKDLSSQISKTISPDEVSKGVIDNLSKTIQPVLDQLLARDRTSAEDIKAAIAQIQVKVPDITMPAYPEMRMPEFPQIPAPIVHVPAPIVNIPETVFPSLMKVLLEGVDRRNPLPVLVVDETGKPYYGYRTLSGGGGANQLPYDQTNPMPVTFAASASQNVVITGATGSLAASIVDSSGVAYSGSNPVPVTLTSVTNSIQSAMIDSSGVQYSGSNPVPVTGNITTITTLTSVTNSIQTVTLDRDGNPFQPFTYGLGEQATALRTLTAGDSVASVIVNSGTITQVTTLVGVTNSLQSAIIDSGGVQYSGSNPIPVTLVTGGITSMLAVGDSAHRTADNGGNPVKVGGIARTTLPTAFADGDRSDFTSDKFGRVLMRPIQVKDLVSTAYVSLATGTEATLLAASAGQTFDLIWVLMSNQSTAAVQVDVRPVNAGNVAMTFQVPANGTVGIAPPVPLPGASDTGNAWTVDMPDITGTTVNISALFSRET